MVHHEEIRKAQRSWPFRPFLLQMADGQSFWIDHPELMFLTRNGRTVVFEHLGHVQLLDSMLITTVSIPGDPPGEPPAEPPG